MRPRKAEVVALAIVTAVSLGQSLQGAANADSLPSPLPTSGPSSSVAGFVDSVAEAPVDGRIYRLRKDPKPDTHAYIVKDGDTGLSNGGIVLSGGLPPPGATAAILDQGIRCTFYGAIGIYETFYTDGVLSLVRASAGTSTDCNPSAPVYFNNHVEAHYNHNGPTAGYTVIGSKNFSAYTYTARPQTTPHTCSLATCDGYYRAIGYNPWTMTTLPGLAWLTHPGECSVIGTTGQLLNCAWGTGWHYIPAVE